MINGRKLVVVLPAFNAGMQHVLHRAGLIRVHRYAQ